MVKKYFFPLLLGTDPRLGVMRLNEAAGEESESLVLEAS